MLNPTYTKKSLIKVRLTKLALLLFATLWIANLSFAQNQTNPYNKNVGGCLDANASNYNPTANIQAKDEYGNLRCTYASCDDIPSDGCLYTSSFSEWNDFFGSEDCENYGGTTCLSGCMDENATNFNAKATFQSKDVNGNILCTYASCETTPSDGCIYPDSFGPYRTSFGHEACLSIGGIACGEYHILKTGGCIDPAATNYDPNAKEQAHDIWNNQLCTYASCTDVPSTGCLYPSSFALYHEHFSADDCIGFGGKACVNSSEGCMDEKATNYDADAKVGAEDQWGNSLCRYVSCDDIPDAAGCIYQDGYAALREDFTAEQCSGYGGTPCPSNGDVKGCTDENAENYNADATIQAIDEWGNIVCTFTSCDAIPEANGCFYATAYTALRDDFTATDCASYGGTPCTKNVLTEESFGFESISLWIKLILLILILCLVIKLIKICLIYRSTASDKINDVETSEDKKNIPSLNHEECLLIMTKLTAIIEKDKVHLNPEYRLNDLAKSSNISAHKVSHVINRIEGISFSDFINRYRIKEAKIMLVSEKHKTYTILAIAHEVGFNSKTAFYNAFKKQCSLSPSAYIKEHQAKD